MSLLLTKPSDQSGIVNVSNLCVLILQALPARFLAHGSRGWSAAVSLLLALGASELHSQPLPPRRPPEPGSARLAHPREAQEVDALDAETCLARLAELEIEFHKEAAPSVAEACAVAIPVRLQSLVVRHGFGGLIHFPARPLVDCRLAEPLALWIGRVVAPVLAESFSSSLRTVRTGPGFECRNRNNETAGKMSAHAIGFALDISGFELANGKALSIGSTGEPVVQEALQTVRTAACGWFTTVLGPGSDAAHEDHLHVDIQPHGANGRYRICE